MTVMEACVYVEGGSGGLHTLHDSWRLESSAMFSLAQIVIY